MANTAEQPLPGSAMCVEHFVEMVAVGEIGVSHDATDEVARVAQCFSGHELGFTNGPQMCRPVTSVGGMAFHEHGALHRMPAAHGIGSEVGQPVGQGTTLGPQVMMWVDDALCGVDDRFVDLIEPFLC